ncbi:MAG: mechanosensitive ion channel family protein, partial [Bacteroidota bacterium]|nr:mechanosensitive ion channel family protein [Bacteroidota bacterium]
SIANIQPILKTPESRIGMNTIEADGFRIIVNVWINAHGFQDAKLKIQQQLIADLKKNNIKLPGM